MTAERNGAVGGMQNPGDLRIPDGFVVKPAKRVYILAPREVLTEKDGYDEVVPLCGGAGVPSEEDEQGVVKETTYGY